MGGSLVRRTAPAGSEHRRRLARTIYLTAKAEWLAQVEPGCEE